MKKLMIIIGAVLLTSVSQAAQFTWGLTASKSAVTAYDGVDVYMILAADYDSSKQMSLADIKEASKSKGTLSVGSMSATTGNVVVNDAWVVEGTDYTWYAIVVSDDKYYVSSATTTSTAVADTGTPASKTFASKSEMATAGNWKTLAASPVPEPTSGLLMVLGLAGLALRRRRS